MAKPILAALRLTRNDVENLSRIFECLLEYVQHGVVNDNLALQRKQSCLTAIETLLSLGYKAISEHGLYTKDYQKHFQNFLQSSCFEKQANIISDKPKVNSVKSSTALTESFIEIFLLALNVFTKLDYPNYYRDFVSVAKVLFGSEVLQQAGLSAIAANLVEIFFNNIVQ